MLYPLVTFAAGTLSIFVVILSHQRRIPEPYGELITHLISTFRLQVSTKQGNQMRVASIRICYGKPFVVRHVLLEARILLNFLLEERL